MNVPLSVYVHIPFCEQRCTYCDFVTYAGMNRWMETYTRSVCTEIQLTAAAISGDVLVHSVYFGGGTPSYLPVEMLICVLDTLRRNFHFSQRMEITLEANPGTLRLGPCTRLRQAGFNRISLGIQSHNADYLKLLGRIYPPERIVQGIQTIRQAGFDNLNVDLMYGLPGQSLEAWQQELTRTLTYQPQHLSLYCLAVEEGTPLERRILAGEVPEPDEDTAADQLEWTCDFMERQHFGHYEVSNWYTCSDQMDFRSRHNMQYWRNDPYLAFGAGAHGYFDHSRYAHPDGIAAYVELIRAAGENWSVLKTMCTEEVVDQYEQMQDEMMLGLRLLEDGVSEKQFVKKYGISPDDVFSRELDALTRSGLVEQAPSETDKIWRLTRRGLMLGNQVFMQFVGEE